MQISKYEKQLGMIDRVIYKITDCNTNLIDHIKNYYSGIDQYSLDMLDQLKQAIEEKTYDKFIYKLCMSIESSTKNIKFILLRKTTNELAGSYIGYDVDAKNITTLIKDCNIVFEKDTSYFKYRYNILSGLITDLIDRYVSEV